MALIVFFCRRRLRFQIDRGNPFGRDDTQMGVTMNENRALHAGGRGDECIHQR